MPTDPTYYTVANAPFFPGAVALLNSLRLTGNAGTLAILDVGLTSDQRDALQPHAVVISLPPEIDRVPYLAKPFAYRFEHEGAIVIIDSDMIVTHELGDVVERAAAGKLCLFPDHPGGRDRQFEEWQERFELRAPMRSGQRYLNAGFLALSLDRWRGLLERWWTACERVPREQIFTRQRDNPYYAADQDALNALLKSEVAPEDLEVLPEREAVLWDRLNEVDVADQTTLECRFDGVRPRILHYSWRPKPWERRAWLRITDDAYTRLLPRVLFADDVELRLDPQQVPPWARPGRAGRATVRMLDLGHRSLKAAINAPPAPLRRRLLALRNEFFYRLGR